MCVIIIPQKRFPSLDMLLRAEKENPNGGGIAWVENGLVRWRKGLTAKEIYELGKGKRFPLLIHFRLATVGGNSPLLCHPFPISLSVSTKLEGSIKGEVLAHNGHWGEWRQCCLNTLIRRGGKFPAGPWSDSRAIAWLTHIYGTGFLNLIGEKVAVLSYTGKLKLFGEGWQEYEGVKLSDTRHLNANKGYCGYYDYWRPTTTKHYS